MKKVYFVLSVLLLSSCTSVTVDPVPDKQVYEHIMRTHTGLIINTVNY